MSEENAFLDIAYSENYRRARKTYGVTMDPRET